MKCVLGAIRIQPGVILDRKSYRGSYPSAEYEQLDDIREEMYYILDLISRACHGKGYILNEKIIAPSWDMNAHSAHFTYPSPTISHLWS